MAGRSSKSKKQSAPNSKPPNSPVLFLDRALGNKVVAQALRDAGVEAQTHSGHFALDAADEEWLLEVGRRGWIVLTKDDRIRYRIAERTALITANVRAFVLVSGNMIGPSMAQVFVAALPAILRLTEQHSPPFIAKVYKDSRVRMLDLPDSAS